MTTNHSPRRPYDEPRTPAPELLARVIAVAPTIAESGVDAHQAEVVHLADLAESTGQSRVLVDVMLDVAEPGVVRTRAFGMLLSRVVHRDPAGSTSGFQSAAQAPRQLVAAQG